MGRGTDEMGEVGLDYRPAFRARFIEVTSGDIVYAIEEIAEVKGSVKNTLFILAPRQKQDQLKSRAVLLGADYSSKC